MKKAPEKLPGAALLLSIPVESAMAPVFAVGAFLMVFGGFQVAEFFLGATAAGAFATWIGLRRVV